ncbi:MAG: hypothetical protein LUE16_08690 [Lachnospiraceae bacterium]|nr:hypothetical protein [Lachnospiraceae bacterium]
MAEFTKKQEQELTAQVNDILNQMAEGKSARDIMARIYVDNLEDKTLKQGEVMADAILKSIREFDSNYEYAKNNLDGFIDNFQKEINADKTQAERCTYWLKFAASLTAITAAFDVEGTVSDDKKAEIEAQLQELCVSEDEATDAYEEELMAQAKEAMLNANILLGGLMKSADELKDISDVDAAEILIDFGSREFESRGIMAMLAYTKIKSGEYSNISAEVTVEQVAAMVCAQVEEARILEAVASGSMTERVAAKLFHILGILVIASLASLSSVFVFFGVVFFGALFAPIFPLDWIVTAGFSYGVWKLFTTAFNGWEAVHKKAFRSVKVGIGAIAGGCKAVARYAEEHVLAPVIAAAKSLWIRILGKKAGDAADGEVVVESEDDISQKTPDEIVYA